MAKMDWTKARRRPSHPEADEAKRLAQSAARRLAPIRKARAQEKLAQQAMRDDHSKRPLTRAPVSSPITLEDIERAERTWLTPPTKER